MNKISFEKPVFTVFYQKPLAARIYKNKSIAKAQFKLKQTNLATIFQFQWLREKRFKNWFDKVLNTMERVKQSIIFVVLRNVTRIKLWGR